jgi:hypothetical protein
MYIRPDGSVGGGLPPRPNPIENQKEYNLPKDVVEEQTIIEKAKDIVSVNPNDTPEKKYNKNLIKYGLIALAGLIVYRLVSKKQVQP